MSRIKRPEAQPRWDEKRMRWHLKAQHEGKRKSFYSPIEGKKGAKDTKRQLENWLDGYSDKADWRLERAWPEYLSSYKDLVGLSTYTQRKVYGELYIIPELGLKKMCAISDQDWQNCITKAGRTVSDRTKRKLSRKTLLNIRATIINFCKFAERSRMIERAPRELLIPRSAEYLPQKILQPADIEKLFSTDGGWWIYLWRFMVVTGLRPGEAMGLQVKDIEGGVLTVRRSLTVLKTETKGKNKNARRRIKLHKLALSILEEQSEAIMKAGIIHSPWVFPNKYGTEPVQSGVASAWDRYREQTGINCTLYGLRHTFYSLTRNDLTQPMAKMLLGHSESMRTDDQYGHEVDGELEQAAAIVGGVFAKILTPQKDPVQS